MRKTLFLELLKKALIMFGFTYFSVAVSTQQWLSVTSAFLASGLYLFTELARIYGLYNENITLKRNKKKLKEFVFLI